MAAQNPANYDTILYRVRPGDSLSRIIRSYHGSVTTLQRSAIIGQIKSDNPGVTNPDRIHPDQLLQMRVPQQYCSASTHPDSTPALSLGEPYYKPLVRQWDFAAPQEKEMLASLTPIMLGTGAASMTMIKQTFTSNAPLLNEMVQNYEAYKAGNLSKGQYDYRRYKILTRLKAKLGPLSRMLNASRLQREVLRISRTRGSVPTGNITRQIGRMGRVAKYASRGGAVLSVVGLGVACNEIANTDDNQKKNEILVESVGGFTGGAIYGAVATVLLIGTPVGWVAALVIGVGGAVAGYASGKGLKALYTTEFSKFDVAAMTRVAEFCKK